MFSGTKAVVWIPLYLFFLFLVIRKYRWNTLVVILFAAILILVSDQLATLVKESVQRLRPSNQPGLPVHIVEAYKGGAYGFYSGHASNTFSIAVFLIVIGSRKWYLLIPALLWAAFMSYTRIYLGVHYPGDILAGGLAGSFIGFLIGKAAVVSIRHVEKETEKTGTPSG